MIIVTHLLGNNLCSLRRKTLIVLSYGCLFVFCSKTMKCQNLYIPLEGKFSLFWATDVYLFFCVKDYKGPESYVFLGGGQSIYLCCGYIGYILFISKSLWVGRCLYILLGVWHPIRLSCGYKLLTNQIIYRR